MSLSALALALVLAQPGPPPWMTGLSRPEDLKVSLATFGPGDEVVEWWGHSALVVEDTVRRESRLYNYGMFGFTDGFFEKFAKGRLEFWVSDEHPVGLTYRFYAQELNRDVRIQVLDLEPAQAMQVARTLGTNVLPQNRVYLYHHYNDNCSTRPRDILDAALAGQLKAATAGPGRMTLRDHTLRYSRVNPPMSLVLDFLQNDELDKPITRQQEAYLPDELEQQLQTLEVTHADGTVRPLVSHHEVLFQARRPPVPQRPPSWHGWLALIGVAMGAALAGLGHLARGGSRPWRILLGLVTSLAGLGGGVLGTGLFLMGLFTDHSVTHRNENLFLLNPLHLALVPLGLMLAMGARRAPAGLLWVWGAIGALTILGVVAKVLPMFDQANWNLILLLGPMNLGGAASWVLHRLGERAPGRRAASALEAAKSTP